MKFEANETESVAIDGEQFDAVDGVIDIPEDKLVGFEPSVFGLVPAKVKKGAKKE
jgi:hypothetical protein